MLSGMQPSPGLAAAACCLLSDLSLPTGRHRGRVSGWDRMWGQLNTWAFAVTYLGIASLSLQVLSSISACSSLGSCSLWWDGNEAMAVSLPALAAPSQPSPGLQALLHLGDGAHVGCDLLGDGAQAAVLLPQLQQVVELGWGMRGAGSGHCCPTTEWA